MRVTTLIMISADENHNKYYNMLPEGRTFRVEYGRVGARPMKRVYPITKWEEVYESKILKGYIDVSDLHINAARSTRQYAKIKDEAVRQLMDDLMRYSRIAMKENYEIKPDAITPEMVREAQAKIEKLSFFANEKDVYNFRRTQLQLFMTIPRRMSNVEEALPKKAEELNAILDNEQSILDVAKTQAIQAKSLNTADGEKTVLETMGVTARLCTEKENETIKKYLTSESAPYFKRAFRINNKKTDDRFYQFMEDGGYKNRDISFLYHGSKNMNWFGIIQEGLLLNPKAPITGKMFGHGLYFANRAKKSINYSDIAGSYWAKGKSSQAFLAVYKVAMKNPKHVDMATQPTAQSLEREGYDSLFAHKGRALFNDEIIIYRQEQCTLCYLIELSV